MPFLSQQTTVPVLRTVVTSFLFAVLLCSSYARDFSQVWLPTVQLVLHADWQEVWHSPHPPFLTVFCSFFVFRVLICFISVLLYLTFDSHFPSSPDGFRHYIIPFGIMEEIFRRLRLPAPCAPCRSLRSATASCHPASIRSLRTP